MAFSIPTKFIFTSVCLAVVALLWIVQVNFSQTFRRLSQQKALWPWFILYGLLVISYFYSHDKGESLFDLNSKLSYVIIPLVVGAGITDISRKTLEQIFVFLISGVAFTGVISLIDATQVWYYEAYNDAFFYHFLVRNVDPNAVYTAWYTFFSISLLMFMPWQYFFQGKRKNIRIALTIFLFIFFVLLSARMFLLLFLVFIIPYFLKKAVKKKKTGIILILSTVVLGSVAAYFVFTTSNPIKNRFDDLFSKDDQSAWLSDYTNIDVNQFNNATLRIFLWRLGVESVRDNNAWLSGVGNGDVHAVLTQKMREYHVKDIENKDTNLRPGFYNANLHNMFVQTLVMIGLPGLILMLFIAFLPVVYIHKLSPYQPFLVFHISSILFMMQEAVLQTQAGIIFYIFISSIFWNLYYRDKKMIIK
ncbi:MAG: O-antigen ligase family protein [Chitinophagales bacterium]|nr:O-antigen ligase family protein [Chitinophagales bacterium]